MIPAMQAVCDRLTWEGALVRHLLDLVADDDLDATVPATGWSVRQTLAHLAMANEVQSIRLALALDDPGATVPSEEERAAWMDEARTYDRERLSQRLSGARSELRVYLDRVDPELLSHPVRPDQTVAEAVRHWAGHYAEHAWHIAELFTDVRHDPLIAMWLLGIDFEADLRPDFVEKQQGLIEEFRAMYDEADWDDDSDG